MIRIVAGEFRHRVLTVPDVETCRPTMDKVREAAFSSLQEKVINSTFLDLFAGSGAIGLEALSRGAKRVFFNEKDPKVMKYLSKNVLLLDPKQEKTIILKKDYNDCLTHLANKGNVFDIVYLDPPYDMKENSNIIQQMIKLSLIKPGSIVLVEQIDKPIELPSFALKIHKYGRKFVGTYTLLE